VPRMLQAKCVCTASTHHTCGGTTLYALIQVGATHNRDVLVPIALTSRRGYGATYRYPPWASGLIGWVISEMVLPRTVGGISH